MPTKINHILKFSISQKPHINISAAFYDYGMAFPEKKKANNLLP